MRLPGHGGVCLQGHIQPVTTPPNPGIPTSLFELLDNPVIQRRILWKVIRNRETIRFALISLLIICQLWIDGFLIVLWAK